MSAKRGWFNLIVSGLRLLMVGIVFVTCESSLLTDIREATAAARGSEVSYQITFDANGGGGTMSKQAVLDGHSVTLNPNAFTRTGYGFEGWATEPHGDVTYSNSAEYTHSVRENRTLYARWAAGKFNIFFDANGGSGSMDDQPVEYDLSVNLSPNSFTRIGYTFAGWATTSVGTIVYPDGATYSHEIDIDRTLYAKWTANQYTVSLNRGAGATGGSTSVTATYDSPMPPATAPSRTGYSFDGYHDGTGTPYYTAAMASAKNWDRTTSATLYAQWNPRAFTVTFDKQNGGGGDASVTAVYDSPMPSATAPNRTGYVFDGYYTGTNGSGIQYYSDRMGSVTNWGEAANTTLYANWRDYVIGDTGPAGGVVFHDKGSYFNGWRYLEAWTSDVVGTYQWKTSLTWTTWTYIHIGTGYENTYYAMAGTNHPVAEVVRGASFGGATDWFLPSKDELHLMYQNRAIIGGFASGIYWSSSESSESNAWGQSFPDGGQDDYRKQHRFSARAARTF